MLSNILLVSAIRQLESVTGKHMSPLSSPSPSGTVAGNVNWFGHHGDSLEN